MRILLRNLDLIGVVLILAAGTLIFVATDADLTWTAPYCNSGEWERGDKGAWAALYHFGTLPALAVCAGALLILIAGFRNAQIARLRRPALFLILLMAIGPGLLANAILKDNWGRPRPRDVVVFGGRESFEKVLSIDPNSQGKSFPCGHATMGFFFIGGYYLFHRQRRVLAFGFFLFGLAFGGLIGWARVVQGGHFPSDVLWAGGLTWLTAALLARGLRPDELPSVDPRFQAAGWGRLAVAGLLIPALLFFALLATPIETRQEWDLSGATEISLRIESADISVQPGKKTSLVSSTSGFGLPGSGIRTLLSSNPSNNDNKHRRLSQRRSGIMTEISQRAQLFYDPSSVRRIKITMPTGSMLLRLPLKEESDILRRWELALGRGSLLINHSGTAFDLETDGGKLYDSEPETERIIVRSALGGIRFDPPLRELPNVSP